MRKTILALVLTLFTAPAFAQNYPTELPKDFQNAPLKGVCGRDKTTSVAVKRFVHPDEKWTLDILVRNGAETLITFVQYPKVAEVSFLEILTPGIETAYSFVIINNRRKEFSNLSREEKELYEKNTLRGKSSISL